MNSITREIAIFSAVLILLSSVLAVVITFMDRGEEFRYTPEESGGGEFLSEDAIEEWLKYDGEVKGDELSGGQDIQVEKVNLSLVDVDVANGSQREGGNPAISGGERLGEGLKSEEDGGGENGVKAVEEGDIVKLDGGHLYILSRYRGLVVVDVSQPSTPRVISSLRLPGNPVEMYVHEPLAVVVLNEGNQFDRSARSLVAVLNLKDLPRIRIAKYLEVEGASAVSRLVGDTLYLATMEVRHYPPPRAMGEGMVVSERGYYQPGGENKGRIRITAINLASPKNLGVVSSAVFEGDRVQVHATPTAVFVALGRMDEGRWDEWTTEIVYVDITTGRVNVRGKFTLKGAVWDKYQLDYYGGSLRVVAHQPGSGTSRLYLLDVRNPAALRLISTLKIPYAGNLMAMRFDGKRAYLIHLPHTPDPLRIVDLRDPTSPELCGVLEIPGWVAHLEPIGDWIVAVGVNTEGGWRASIYLFYVKDPYHPELKDTKDVGDFYSYSEAIWEPKAVTMIRERSTIVIPYNGYLRDSGKTQYGLFIVKYDLQEGRLTVAGNIATPEEIRRTRAKGDYLLGTSDTVLVSVDLNGEPSLKAVIPLVEDVVEVKGARSGVIMLSFRGASAYLKFITSDGEVEDVWVQENISRNCYHELFTVGNKILVVLGDYYSGTVDVHLLEGNPPVLLDSVELSGDGIILSLNRPLMVGDKMLIPGLRGAHYSREEADDGGSLKGDGEAAVGEREPAGSAPYSYLLSFPGKIVVERLNLTLDGTGTLFALSENLYYLIPESGEDVSCSLYRIDLGNLTQERLGVVRGWYVLSSDTYLFTEFWNEDCETLNVYYLNGSTFHLYANITLPFWGEMRYHHDTIYVVYNTYYRWLDWSSGREGGVYRPGTFVCEVDMRSMETVVCVRINGSYFYSPILALEEGILLYDGYWGQGRLTMLEEGSLEPAFTLNLSSYPQGVVIKDDRIYVGQGLYGYVIKSVG